MPLRSRLRDLKVKYSKGRAYQDSLPVSGSLAHSPGETLQTPLPDIEASACSIDTGLRHAGSSKASSSGPGALPDAKLLTLDLGASKTILQGRNFVTTSGDLWDRAYKQLKDKNEHLVLQYESLLAENLRTSHASHSLAKTSILPELGLGQPAEIHVSTSSNFLAPLGSPQRQHQMKALLEEKIKDDEDAILKFNIGSTQVIVRDQLDKVVKVVAAAKDFVGASVASEPHAALAWTGVCTLLPVSGRPMQFSFASRSGTEIAVLE